MAGTDRAKAPSRRGRIACQIRELLAVYQDTPAEPGVSLMTISTSADVAALLMAAMRDLEQEQFHVLLLDTKNHVLRDVLLYQGTVNSALIRGAEVFREAVRENCTAIIVAHNHPSGDPTPSPEDVRVTRDLVSAGKLLDIAVLDHLVIGRDCYRSVRRLDERSA